MRDTFEGASDKRKTRNAEAAVTQLEAAPEKETRVSTRERAEWLWKLANGSLVVPLILALIVLYYGLKQIADFSANQHAALQPILQHQLEVMREDRLRFEEDRQRVNEIFHSQINAKTGQRTREQRK